MAAVERPQEPTAPVGLGTHRNEYYEFVVTSITRQDDRRVKVDGTIESRSSRGIKLLCQLHETMLTDQEGTIWHQGVEDNREGLCTRGLELSPHQKRRAVLIFTAPEARSATQFILHFSEKLPRGAASFTIDGLTVGPPPGPTEKTP